MINVEWRVHEFTYHEVIVLLICIVNLELQKAP